MRDKGIIKSRCSKGTPDIDKQLQLLLFLLFAVEVLVGGYSQRQLVCRSFTVYVQLCIPLQLQRLLSFSTRWHIVAQSTFFCLPPDFAVLMSLIYRLSLT